MKLILTYKTNLNNIPWFKQKHTYLLTTIGLMKDSGEADFNKGLSTKTLKRIMKPTCN